MSLVFYAPDIECEHCVEGIRAVLIQLNGIRVVEVDVEACTVSVDFGDGQPADSTIRAALEEAGYPTSP